ncbi:13986_t:CDS:2, partial [Gigaspora margarita]
SLDKCYCGICGTNKCRGTKKYKRIPEKTYKRHQNKKESAKKREKKANCTAIKEKEEVHSRINTIWVDYHWKQSVLVCKTKTMELRTGTENRRIRRKRLKIDIESMNEKNWEEYQTELNKELKRKFSKNSEKGSIQSDILDYYTLKNKTLDELWDIIENSIKKSAANKLSQKKKAHVVKDISYTDAENKKLRKDIRILGKWYRKLKKNKERGITVQEVKELECFIELLNNCWGLEVVESRASLAGNFPRRWKNMFYSIEEINFKCYEPLIEEVTKEK